MIKNWPVSLRQNLQETLSSLSILNSCGSEDTKAASHAGSQSWYALLILKAENGHKRQVNVGAMKYQERQQIEVQPHCSINLRFGWVIKKG